MAIPTPYAGSYYPIYNAGPNQYIPPTTAMPFDKISVIYVAFAHAYPASPGSTDQATLQLEAVNEPARLVNLVEVARQVNPDILFLLSLGWGHNDWTYISNDYNGKRQFPKSVVDLVQQYGLDGFDIDDESLNGSSGYITQEDFNGVISLLREALDGAGAAQGKTCYLTITPAFNHAQVTKENISDFDLINLQSYSGVSYENFSDITKDRTKFAYGINSENCPSVYFPDEPTTYGMSGMFNWTLSADSNECNQYAITHKIAERVGYKGRN